MRLQWFVFRIDPPFGFLPNGVWEPLSSIAFICNFVVAPKCTNHLSLGFQADIDGLPCGCESVHVSS